MTVPHEYLGQEVGQSGYRVLGLDLDGVCANYTAGLREFCMEEMDLPATAFPDPKNYNLVKAGWPFDDIPDYLTWHGRAVANGLYRTVPPMQGVVEALQALDEVDVHIRIVTHRLLMGGMHQRVVSDTAAWLDEHEIPYMSLCFTGLKDSISATLHIDDSPSMVINLRAEGQRVLVFDQPYNRELEEPRMSGWVGSVDQILDLMERPASH